jgi:hypothetical protein
MSGPNRRFTLGVSDFSFDDSDFAGGRHRLGYGEMAEISRPTAASHLVTPEL